MLTSTIYFDKIIITKNIDKEMYVKMKSRKFKAVLAAVSAIAVLATAMTGFAATVETTTTYGIDDAEKVSVTVNVTGAGDNAEVTYLAETTDGTGVNNTKILYIDQKTADSSGNVTFDYKIAKGNLGATKATVVKMGTDSGVALTPEIDGLGIKAATTSSGEGYTISYGAYADDATVRVVINATTGYEIASVTYTGSNWTKGQLTLDIPKAAIDSLVVVAQPTEFAPVAGNVMYVNNGATAVDGKYYVGAIIKVSGDAEAGVVYGDSRYPANDGLGSYKAVKLQSDNPITGEVKAYVGDAYVGE